MEEVKKKPNPQQIVECSKCHKSVPVTDCESKGSKFVCKNCIKSKKTRSIISIICGVILIGGLVTWGVLYNKEYSGKGFDGVGEIQDSVMVSVESKHDKFNLSKTTAQSSAVSTQAPITNLEDFKNVFSKNVSESEMNNLSNVIIPSVKTLFEINSKTFRNNGQLLVKEFADAFTKTNQESKILVEGFTCDLGGVEFNNDLSKDRAETVKNILLESGLPEDKIEVKWYGKTRYNEFQYPKKEDYRCVILSIN